MQPLILPKEGLVDYPMVTLPPGDEGVVIDVGQKDYGAWYSFPSQLCTFVPWA
jgi:hypothetical protein